MPEVTSLPPLPLSGDVGEEQEQGQQGNDLLVPLMERMVELLEKTNDLLRELPENIQLGYGP